MDKHLPDGGPFYFARVPAFSSKAAHKHSKDILFRQVCDSIASEVKESADLQEALRCGCEDDLDSVMAIECYKQHPKVKSCLEEHGSYPLPLALYVDGVRYTAQTAGRND
eukprot:3825173-Pyramimonas_sp.AAC.1